MSNEEKLKRSTYRARRQMWIIIQLVVIAIATFVTAFSSIRYYQKDQATYINYVEEGDVDYKVYIKDNAFIEDEYIEVKDESDNKAFVASLIDKVEANFLYELEMETTDVDYEYSYVIESVLVVTDKESNPLLEHKEIIKESETITQNSSSNLSINEVVSVDYAKYNSSANAFIEVMDLKDVNPISSLVLNAHIKVDGKCDKFQEDSSNEYTVSLVIPLTTKTIDIEMTSSVPTEESKILACETGINKDVFKKVAIYSGLVDAALILVLIIIVLATRNKHINYEIKVKRLVSNYKSYIQKINNPFDMEGYQVLYVDTFNEMLEIRDTIQNPILMNENDDQTRTQFIIPTPTKLLYLYEVKVAGYDDMYRVIKEETVVKEETSTPVVEEKVAEEIIQEPVEEVKEDSKEEQIIKEDNSIVDEIPAPAVEEEPIVEANENENDPTYINSLNYSFEAKLILAEEETKEFYFDLVKYCKEYGVKVSRSWKKERIYLGRNLFGVLLFKGKTLCVGLPLDPKEYVDSKYRFQDMSEYKKYQETPFLIKLTSGLKVRHTIELLEQLFNKADVQNKNLTVTFRKLPKKSRNALLKEGLIKEGKSTLRA